MRYRINWTEVVGYYCYVEADSPEEAIEDFYSSGTDGMPEPDGYAVEHDAAEATPDPLPED